MTKKRIKYKKKNFKQSQRIPDINKQKTVPQPPVIIFLLKICILMLMILGLIIYSDKKGNFNPSMQNNHTIKKWDSFYNFSKHNNVDILLLGNSHLYTGINPKNLSITLGTNAFILASPGTNVADSYWALKEALRKCKPKAVVLETYVITNFNPYQLKLDALSNQFTSFSARKDILTKIQSTPYLFSIKNYLYAWSNTLRNHNFIFSDKKQLQENKEIIKKKKKSRLHRKNEKLYLGRYIRFTNGIQDSLLTKYRIEGAAVDGKDYNYSNYAKIYIDRIVKLCQKNDIELIFLTLPMYEKHVKNYSRWKDKLSEILGNYPNKWLDMQDEKTYRSIGYGAFAFENTYLTNQHMTYSGSLLATYSLASLMRDSLHITFPEKSYQWHNLFYGDEGYFENYSPNKNDIHNRIICQNKMINNNVVLKEVLLIDINNKSKKIIGKIDRDIFQNMKVGNFKLRLLVKFRLNNLENQAIIDLQYDKFHTPKNDAVFIQVIKPLEITDVLDGVVELQK